MSPFQRGQPNFWFFSHVVVEVNFGQVGRSNSLSLLSYRRLADLVVSNLRSNGAFGHIPAYLSLYHFSETTRLGHNFIVHSLRKIAGQGRRCNLILLDSYGRVADFVISKLTAEENFCPNIELLE